MNTPRALSFSEDMPKPILASIFSALGWIFLLGAALSIVFLLKTMEGYSHALLIIYTLIAGAFSSVIFFGISQMIYKIALIEFHASKQKSDAILHSLHKIEHHLEALRNNGNINQ